MVDGSRADPIKAYVLGEVDERKAICHFLSTRALRSAHRYASAPWWDVLGRMKARWLVASYAFTIRDIEQGEHVTDQAVWLVELDGGVIFAREAFKRDSDEDRNGEDPQGLSGEAMPARAEGIAQDQSGDPQ